MARLFLAVIPPAAVLDHIAALPRPDEPGVRWTRRHQWHVTLRFLGEAEPEDVVAALEGTGGFHHPVERVVLGPTVSRLGRNVVCLPVGGLDGLAAVVGERTRSVGQPPDPRPFAGHLTLARLRHRAACGVAGTPFTDSFLATRVELIESELGPSGAAYEVRWVGALDPRSPGPDAAS